MSPDTESRGGWEIFDSPPPPQSKSNDDQVDTVEPGSARAHRTRSVPTPGPDDWSSDLDISSVSGLSDSDSLDLSDDEAKPPRAIRRVRRSRALRKALKYRPPPSRVCDVCNEQIMDRVKQSKDRDKIIAGCPYGTMSKSVYQVGKSVKAPRRWLPSVGRPPPGVFVTGLRYYIDGGKSQTPPPNVKVDQGPYSRLCLL